MLLDHNLIYVTGKGGVGRSTVAAALGLAAAQRGRRTIVCEVSEQDRLARMFGRDGTPDEEVELAENLSAISIEPQRALRGWLGSQLGSRALTKLLFENNAFQYFAAAAPGAFEMATIVKVWELAQARRWDRSASSYETVIVDAPASGHGLGMLRTPKTFANLARVGPIHKQSERVRAWLGDRRCSAYVSVALAEEMPVSETLEFEPKLSEEVGIGLSAIIVNGVFPKRFTKADCEALNGVAARDGHAGPVRSALAAARTEHGWARNQANQLARLRRGAEAPVLTLPFLFEPSLGVPELERLAGELAKKKL